MTPRDHVDVVVHFEEQDFEIRIHRDGTLEFLDPEIKIEYELAFTAMGGDKSIALVLLDAWERWPSRILGKTRMVQNIAIRLAVDYCSRVMPIYYKSFPSDARPRKILKELTRRSRGKGTDLDSMAITWAIASQVLSNAAHAKYQRYAVECAGRALYHAAKDVATDGNSITSVADTAAAAVAHDEAKDLPDTPRYNTQEFNDILDRESSWQIRRFIDVVSAVQEKRRIPKLGETL